MLIAPIMNLISLIKLIFYPHRVFERGKAKAILPRSRDHLAFVRISFLTRVIPSPTKGSRVHISINGFVRIALTAVDTQPNAPVTTSPALVIMLVMVGVVGSIDFPPFFSNQLFTVRSFFNKPIPIDTKGTSTDMSKSGSDVIVSITVDTHPRHAVNMLVILVVNCSIVMLFPFPSF